MPGTLSGRTKSTIATSLSAFYFCYNSKYIFVIITGTPKSIYRCFTGVVRTDLLAAKCTCYVIKRRAGRSSISYSRKVRFYTTLILFVYLEINPKHILEALKKAYLRSKICVKHYNQ